MDSLVGLARKEGPCVATQRSGMRGVWIACGLKTSGRLASRGKSFDYPTSVPSTTRNYAPISSLSGNGRETGRNTRSSLCSQLCHKSNICPYPAVTKPSDRTLHPRCAMDVVQVGNRASGGCDHRIQRAQLSRIPLRRSDSAPSPQAASLLVRPSGARLFRGRAQEPARGRSKYLSQLFGRRRT